MSALPPKMDPAEFERIASACRWSSRSLGVVRLILVEGAPSSNAATAHDMSNNQARVLLQRFIDKATQSRVAAFMEHEKPRLAATAVKELERFDGDLRTLAGKGYSTAQLVAFLKSNGVITSAATVRKFIRSHKA